MTEPRRTFIPVVLVAGLAAGALAMAGTQPWFAPSDDSYACEAPCVGVGYEAGTGWAFALVMLAALGVVLVSRGRFRRLVAVVGLLASVGAVVSAIDAVLNGADDVRGSLEQIGVMDPQVDGTGWLVVGVLATVVSVVAWSGVMAYVRQWPEMGRRYDTPASEAPEDLWKALDHGRDPTS